MIQGMIAGRAHGRSSRSLSGPSPDMIDALPTGEAALWRAVVLQAFQDATLGLHAASARRKPRLPSATRRTHARAARDWLLGGGTHLHRVCDTRCGRRPRLRSPRPMRRCATWKAEPDNRVRKEQ